MFAATLEAGKVERALDLVQRLHIEKSFELAMKIANNHHKLADKIEDMMDKKFGADDDEEEESVVAPRVTPQLPKRAHPSMGRNVRAKTMATGF